ncbi:hypothetical protein [Nocardioides convexus]|uniref:hypothetical protein n=1 Tax=Nocardioides convexus TaxID=2712224 RepID=UPI002418AACF|nr:hypothetical protein [Nocardioides convexus]
MLWHFTVSLDGFVAGPGHDMSLADRLRDPPRADRGPTTARRGRSSRGGSTSTSYPSCWTRGSACSPTRAVLPCGWSGSSGTARTR